MNLCWSLDKVGPICRTVEDCAIVLGAIRGSDGIDHAVIDAPNYRSNLDLRKIRVGYRRGQLSSSIVNRLAAIVGQEQMVDVQLPANSLSLMGTGQSLPGCHWLSHKSPSNICEIISL